VDPEPDLHPILFSDPAPMKQMILAPIGSGSGSTTHSGGRGGGGKNCEKKDVT
jgi:hypothetical protein